MGIDLPDWNEIFGGKEKRKEAQKEMWRSIRREIKDLEEKFEDFLLSELDDAVSVLYPKLPELLRPLARLAVRWLGKFLVEVLKRYRD